MTSNYFSSCAIRWDIEALETLPEYMKICYLALFNFVHEVSYDTLKDYGWNILPFLKEEVFSVFFALL